MPAALPGRGDRVQVMKDGRWIDGRCLSVSTRGARVLLVDGQVVFLNRGRKHWRFAEDTSGEWPRVP